MTVADIAVYLAAENARTSDARHGKRAQTYVHGDPWTRANPTGFRAYALLGRYKAKAKRRLHWEQSPITGRWHYFTDKAHLIFGAVLADIDAGAKLSVTAIARLCGASRSYVSKTIGLLRRFGFIEITSSERGRFGGIIARIASRIRQCFLPPSKKEETLTTQRLSGPRYPGWGRFGKLTRELEADFEGLEW